MLLTAWTQKHKQEIIFTIFPEVSWFWQSIFLYRNNSLNDYIAFFRAYLVTILKALLHCIKLRWGSLVLSIFANSWFFFCCSLVHAGKKMNFTSLHCFISWTFLKFGFSEKATKFEKIFVVLLTRASCSVRATAYLSKSQRRLFKTNVDKSYCTKFKKTCFCLA